MEEKKGRNLQLEINNSEENLIEGKKPKLEIKYNEIKNNKKERKIENININNFYNLSEKRPNSTIFRGKKKKYKITSKINGSKYLDNKDTLKSDDTTSKEVTLKKEPNEEYLYSSISNEENKNLILKCK